MRHLWLVGILFTAVTAGAVDFTSARSGNWDDPDTWSPTGTPGAGDRVSIESRHIVTIPESYTATIGDFPADDTATPAIQCTSTGGSGALAISGTLIFRGPVRQCNSAWTVGPGAMVTHDSSGAAAPADTHYTWKLGLVNGQSASRLVIEGTAERRAILNIAADSGNAGGFQGGTLTTQDAGQVQASYANFSHWGTASSYFLRAWPHTQGAAAYFDSCNINNSGPISLYGIRPNVTFRLLKTVITTPLIPPTNRYIELGYGAYLTATPSGGDLRIEGSYIEGTVALNVNSNHIGKDAGFTFRNTILAGGTKSGQVPFLQSNSPAFAPGNWDLVFLQNRIQSSSDSGSLPAGTLRRTILTRNYRINPHWVYLSPSDTNLDGWIAEAEMDNGIAGDILMLIPGRNPYRVTIRNGITPPTPGGQAPGVTINYNTNINCDGNPWHCPAITAEQNTYLGDAQALTAIGGESNNGGAGLFASIQFNIAWRTTPGVGFITKWHALKVPVDGTFALADSNNWWNFTNEIRYDRTDTTPGSYVTPPGLKDTNADPQFLEWRNMRQWGSG
ncbi:MAG: hypothetical protein IPP47_20405 [Bryobacterales bacterium]|nr:hypothetical protein [Bryobacterales bacterium]